MLGRAHHATYDAKVFGEDVSKWLVPAHVMLSEAERLVP
jgi:hypothetical protein